MEHDGSLVLLWVAALLQCWRYLHAGQCWWVSALHAGGYPLCLLVGICSVCSNAGGISALHCAGQCWGGICMLDKAPCCTMPQCTMLHAGGYLLCTLVGTCSACSNAGGTSALHCAAPCWTKHDFPPKPQKQKHLHAKSASQGYCTQTPSTRQH